MGKNIEGRKDGKQWQETWAARSETQFVYHEKETSTFESWRTMRPPRSTNLPSAYLVAAILLALGDSFQVQPITFANEPALVSADRRREEEVAWSPAARKMKLEATPARSNSRREEIVEGYVRPAWELLGVMIVLFLYLWIRTEFGSRIMIDLFVLDQPLRRGI